MHSTFARSLLKFSILSHGKILSDRTMHTTVNTVHSTPTLTVLLFLVRHSFCILQQAAKMTSPMTSEMPRESDISEFMPMRLSPNET